jgi:hypothetical protein
VPDTLVGIVENYFTALRDVHRIGAGTKERSYYPALAGLMNDIGQQLKPKVLCLSDLGNIGAGHPDFGLFAANQVQRGEPRRGQIPERGVIEGKSADDDAWLAAATKQVSKYFGGYRLVIVTNIRDFLIIGEGVDGQATKLESFRLAVDATAFWAMVATPKKSAAHIGPAFGEYLKRALTQSVALREPKDVAWFIASYARDALSRVEEAGKLPALANIRSSLEEALGVTFEADKGAHFFRSTLVQTLFYGIFSAWVLWVRETPRTSARFDWRTAIWHLTVPFISTLFQQLASPAHLQPLRLVQVLDWTAATLNRIDSAEFFKRFNDAEAVQFFYEPFLEAFDPELRKELGVWYTPTEVVTYMVARVDKALREDLGVAEGLASEKVYILDPCCGTGAFLAAVLRKIDASLADQGYGALKGQMVKKAALTRVFGFEIMPAPFVVAHLQVGLVLQELGVTLEAEQERAGVYLTNALTGWEPHVNKPLPFPELEEERGKADKVKQEAPILVILGNPPYNGFAGVAIAEERVLVEAYRTAKRVRPPEGQGLNELYVRFFRMAERRIAEKTGQGVVCFISNYSWLDGLSHTGMREWYLEAFDTIFIDNLHGDRIISERAPDGKSSETVFAIRGQSPGIKVGTAISTLVRKSIHKAPEKILYRDFDAAKADDRRASMIASLEGEELRDGYHVVMPILRLGLPFKKGAVGAEYLDWPRLSELLPVSFPGVKTSHDEFLVSIDRDALEGRLDTYFDPGITHEDMRVRHPSIMSASKRFDPVLTRDTLRRRGKLAGNVVRYAYRPFDVRWLYWEPETKLLDEKRSEYWPHVLPGNSFVEAREKEPQAEFSRGTVVQKLADNFGNGLSSFFPLHLND